MERKIYKRIEKQQLQLGNIITRDCAPPLAEDYPCVESILESQRPDGCLSRSKSVNMRDDRDFSRMGIDTFEEGYVHEIEPLTAVEKRDVTWIGVLQARYPKGNLKLTEKYTSLSDKQVADNYWGGTLSDNPALEYATEKAKVVFVEFDLSPVRPDQLADAFKQVAEHGNNFLKS